MGPSVKVWRIDRAGFEVMRAAISGRAVASPMGKWREAKQRKR